MFIISSILPSSNPLMWLLFSRIFAVPRHDISHEAASVRLFLGPGSGKLRLGELLAIA